MTRSRSLLLLVALLGAAACRSAESAPAEPLPFHVAVIPLAQEDLLPTEKGERDGRTDMRLAPDAAELSARLAAALDGTAFTRATLLVAGSGSAGTNGTNGTNGHAQVVGEQDWVGTARRIGADLVLECELEYGPTVWQRANGNFWLNLPLFLLGGPFTYFVKDRTYEAEAELLGNFYDVRLIDDEEVLLGDRFARVLFTNARFQGEDLNFLSRASGRPGSYAASLLIPSGFLAKEGEDLESHLDGLVTESLCRDFAGSVLNKRQQVIRSDLAPFHLDPAEVAVQRTPDGRLRVSGRAHLPKDDTLAERMNRYRVTAGASTVEGTFADPEAGAPGRFATYPFAAELNLDPGVELFHVELEAGTFTRFARTYTFPVPASGGGGG